MLYCRACACVQYIQYVLLSCRLPVEGLDVELAPAPSPSFSAIRGSAPTIYLLSPRHATQSALFPRTNVNKVQFPCI